LPDIKPHCRFPVLQQQEQTRNKMMHRLILKNFPTRILAGLTLAITALVLSGCGGGDTGAEGPDAGIIDYPIAYVKRPTPLDDQGNFAQEDVRDPLFFGAGGNVYLRNRATTSASETNITSGIVGTTGDVKDLDVSFDATRLVFALRVEDPAPNDDTIPPPTWNIYEYDLTTKQLSRVINDDITAEEGDDVDPHYLPDGRIIFSSTRQKTSRAQRIEESVANNTVTASFTALDDAGNEHAFELHVMDADGTNIKQVTFNQSHDLDPVVLASGEVLFSRWDNAYRNNTGFSLYKMTPDGGNLQLVYGAHSHDTGTAGSTIQFTQPREKPDGSILVIAKPDTGTFGGGNIFRINLNSYIDYNRTTSGASATGGQAPATINPITTTTSPSLGGRYLSVFPLWDGTDRMLVSKGMCQILVNGQPRICTADLLANNPAAPELPPAYNIWMYNPGNSTEKLVVLAEANTMITDVVAMQPRSRPSISPGASLDANLESEGSALLHIRSVYDLDGSFNNFGSGIADLATLANSATPATNRPARFLRLVKPVALPDPDDDPALPDLANSAFGPQRALGMQQILGYAPIEPDGSVLVKVPANTPFTIEVLDEMGRRIGPRHRNWLQLQAGETRECNGCHSHPSTGTPMPHGRNNAGLRSINPGTWSDIDLDTTGFIFFLNGETMAQARYGRCGPSGSQPCAVTSPANQFAATPDVLYEDIWVNAGNTPNPILSYSYADLTTPPPVSASCQLIWEQACRAIINYEQHIDPLWSAPRTDAMGADVTCTGCHSTRDAANTLRAPAGQLNLTNITTDYPASFIPDPDQVHPYRELLFTSDRLEVNGNALVVSTTPTGPIDPVTGLPTDVTVTVNPPLTANGALLSTLFFSRFAPGQSHEGYLTPAELRLIAEWVDLGAQYYNDPFDPGAPTN
jgi:hypothetical protein